MTHSETNGTPRYRVEMAPRVREAVLELLKVANKQKRGEQFVAAFRAAMDQLRSYPNRVGEPQYRLPAMRLTVRSVLIAPIAIHFAVSEDRPVVFIKEVKLLANKGN